MILSVGHRTCSYTMLFAFSLQYIPISFPKYEFKFNILAFLIMALPQK